MALKNLICFSLLLFGLRVMANTATADTILVKEFNYVSPGSSEVYLVWYPETLPIEMMDSLNPASARNNKMLYSAMNRTDSIFSTTLNIPRGTDIYYTFWITKNADGQYQDFWDNGSSGRLKVTDSGSVQIKARNKPQQSRKKSLPLLAGLGFLSLLLTYLWLRRAWSRRQNLRGCIPYGQRIFFTGLSLLLFSMLARAIIIRLPLSAPYKDLMALPKIIKAGIGDILLIIITTLVFFGCNRILRTQKAKRAIFILYAVFAALLTLISFVNILVVTYLGRPLNYQWLYYSDFLGSDEARSALSAQFTWLIAAGLACVILAMFLFSGIASRTYGLLSGNTYFRRTLVVGAALFVIVALFGAASLKTDWPAGKKENAVVSFASSYFTANNNPSFFSMEIPEDDVLPGRGILDTVDPFRQKDSSAVVKNVLFVVLESAGAQYMDGFGGGYNLSPNLNRLEAQALKVSSAYAHAPGTNRSMVSLLGSIYPKISYTSITQEHPDIVHPTISSVLRQRGYRTSFFSSADLGFQNSSEFLAHREFDLVEDYSDIPCAQQFELNSSKYTEGNGIDDLCLTERLGEWLDRKPEQNFFSVIWTVQGHYPYYFEGQDRDFGVSDVSFNRYLNILNHYDKVVGSVMQVLSERSLDKSTLVVVTGDHGEVFGQHSQYGHGTHIYEENLKVPLYFINSGLFDGITAERLAGLKDIPSTTLAIMGIETPSSWQGANLLAGNPDELFYFAPWSDYLFGYRYKDLKFIFNETTSSVQVFNLARDPGELHNIATEIPEEEVEKARYRVASWVQGQDAFIKKAVKATQIGQTDQ